MLLRVIKYAIIVSPEAGGAVLLLKDEKSDVALPIGIDLHMGRMISDFMKRIPRKRPWTHDLMGNILSKCGARLNRVAIKDRKQGVYSAVIHIEAQGREIELDCRPSDAVALAICGRVPIYVSEKLLSMGYVIKIKSGDEDPYETWLQNLTPDFFNYEM
jgi:bifunctional DNase/RNase